MKHGRDRWTCRGEPDLLRDFWSSTALSRSARAATIAASPDGPLPATDPVGIDCARDANTAASPATDPVGMDCARGWYEEPPLEGGDACRLPPLLVGPDGLLEAEWGCELVLRSTGLCDVGGCSSWAGNPPRSDPPPGLHRRPQRQTSTVVIW